MQIYNDKYFENPVDKIIAMEDYEIINAFNKIETYKNKGFYLLGYTRYDLYKHFLNQEIHSEYPIIYFEVYDKYKRFKQDKKNNINIYSENEITFEEYKKAISTIKQEISEGNTYEVNYTYPYKIYSENKSIDIYNYLLNNQKTVYSTYIKNDWEEILSFSPELFFKIKNNKILTKPMKGTIKRGKNKKEDKYYYELLKNDTKNRSENVMIVDLLRNDLSKISKTGTVQTNKLFEIERHKTLFQMTSEITSNLKDNTTLYDVFRAIYPCGSITGAPKISTMNIIEKIEHFNREIYCGSIGFISKKETIFSVPIRILQKKNKDNFYKYYVGGAIVWLSETKDEWEETKLKKKILENKINYELIETMLVEDNKIFLLDYHKKRLLNSAKKLNFDFDFKSIKFNTEKNCIIRFLLSKDGNYKIEYKKINPITTKKIKISENKLDSNNFFIKHKTTFRPWYKIDLENYFDVIFKNKQNEITEGTRSNIVIKKNDKYYTPKLSSGLLNGCFRQYLIDTKFIKEKTLYEKDLFNADKIYCINSVRKFVEVEL